MKSLNHKRLFWIAFLTITAFSMLSCQLFSGLTLETPGPIAPSEPTPLTETTNPQPTAENGANPSASPDLVNLQDSLVSLYEKVNPGVVAIQVLTQDGGSLGSGFVIDKEGHVITNYHVVEGNTDFEVDFPSGFKTRGKIIGTDIDSDLAIIKVDAPAEELVPLSLGDSSKVKVGQTVIAIGNPFGLNGTMTSGIVSARGRTLESMREAPGGNYFTAGDLIQTDTAINPGNSGGPLLNLNGEVIGVNRAIRTFNFTNNPGQTQEPLNSGVGFAVAINLVKRVAPVIIKKGSYDYPYLGVSSLEEITLMQQEALGLPQANGAYITNVTPGSPADKAGLRGGLNGEGDLITAIDDVQVNVFSNLLSYILDNKSPGDTVRLTILRDGKEMEVNLTLGKRP